VGPSSSHEAGAAGVTGNTTGFTYSAGGTGGTDLGGTGAATSDMTAAGAGTALSPARNWQDLLERGEGELLSRTTTPVVPDTSGFGIGENSSELPGGAAVNGAEAVGSGVIGSGTVGSGVIDSGTFGAVGTGSSLVNDNLLPPVSGPKTYTVVPGDTYWTIAQREYGNGAYYTHIMRANPSVPANRLKANVKLVIPDRSEVVPTGAQPVVAVSNLDSRTQYRVQKNDNLYTICKRLYGTTDKVSKLYQLNKDLIGPNPNSLKLGMVLQLPDPPASADTSPAFGIIQ
jgi:nucleoid-associated protein YgaU